MRARDRVPAGLGILLLLGWTLFPLYWVAVSSLTPEARLFQPPALVPPSLTLDHYRALFATRSFWLPIRNSLVVALATTLLSLVLGAPCAYALARLRLRGRGLILGILLAAAMFPQIAVVSPLYLGLRALGLIDTYLGLVLPYLIFALPLTVWLLTAFFRQLPGELEEAALIDGAGRLRAFREIILPLSAPGLATTAVLILIYCWNEFLFALSFTLGPERQTVPVAIALFRGQYQVPWGEILAGAVVATAPVVLLIFVFQRRVVRGLTAGAVKG